MRILVSASSKHGATAEIGRRIATVLRHHGLDVDVAQPEHITALHRYDGFVLGSAIYGGHWRREALHLVEEHRQVIEALPCWLFSSGPVGADAPTEPMKESAIDELLRFTNAKEHRVFGGRLELERLSVPERWLARWVRAKGADTRPWPEIDAWATAIAAEVIAGHSGITPVAGIPDEGQ